MADPKQKGETETITERLMRSEMECMSPPPIDTPVQSWEEFMHRIKMFFEENAGGREPVGFRGQEREYGENGQSCLKPSFARVLPDDCTVDAAIQLERNLIHLFQIDGHRHLPNWEIPDLRDGYRALSWLMTMQQYGAPTRLMDWTESPYVATYFAVKGSPNEDGVLWMLDYNKLKTALVAEPKTEVNLGRINEWLASGKGPTLSSPAGICAVYIKTKRSERMYAQQGYYLVCEDPRLAHDDVMLKIATKADMEPFLHKLTIPADKKLEFLSNLRLMNITGASLFPGADGLGMHVAEMSKLIAHKFRNMPPCNL